MKRFSTRFALVFALGLALSVCFGMASTAFAATPSVQTLGKSQAYRVDLDSNGVTDTVYLKEYGYYSYGYWRVSSTDFYVNDRIVKSWGENIGVNMQLVTLKNGKKFLHVTASFVYTDTDAIYSYKAGALKLRANVKEMFGKYADKTAYATNVKAVGNRIDVTAKVWSRGFGCFDAKASYKYSKGVLKTVKTGTVVSYTINWGKASKSKHPYVAARKSMKVYKSAGKKKVKFKLTKGTKAKLLKTWYNGKTMYVKIKTKSGKTGWIKSPKNALMTEYSPDGNISTFKGLWYQH